MKVFITGGTSGIGRSLARLYLRQGARVGVCGGPASLFQAAYPGPGPKPEFFAADVTHREQIKSAIAQFSLGELDLLVACAGINNEYRETEILDFDRELRIMQVNCLGVMNAFEGALGEMAPRRRGRLVAISSASGVAGFPDAPAYCASKAAVLKLCESLSIRLRPLGVQVSCIAPGFVQTPLTEKNPRKMPMVVSPDRAAALIARAIARGRPLYFFPWPVALLMGFLERIPRSWFRFFFRRKSTGG